MKKNNSIRFILLILLAIFFTPYNIRAAPAFSVVQDNMDTITLSTISASEADANFPDTYTYNGITYKKLSDAAVATIQASDSVHVLIPFYNVAYECYDYSTWNGSNMVPKNTVGTYPNAYLSELKPSLVDSNYPIQVDGHPEITSAKTLQDEGYDGELTPYPDLNSSGGNIFTICDKDANQKQKQIPADQIPSASAEYKNLHQYTEWATATGYANASEGGVYVTAGNGGVNPLLWDKSGIAKNYWEVGGYVGTVTKPGGIKYTKRYVIDNSGSTTKKLYLTLNASPTDAGTVSGKDTTSQFGKTVTLTLDADANGQATFTNVLATKIDPNKFVKWDKISGTIVSDFNFNSCSSQSITISENTILTAYFNNDRTPPTVTIMNRKSTSEADQTNRTIMTNTPLQFGVTGYDKVDAQWEMNYWYEIKSDTSSSIYRIDSGNIGVTNNVNIDEFGIYGGLSTECSSDSAKQGRYDNGLAGTLKFTKTGTYTIVVHCINSAGLPAVDSNKITVNNSSAGDLRVKYKILDPPDVSTGHQYDLDTSIYSSAGLGKIEDDILYPAEGSSYVKYSPKFTGYWDVTDKNYTLKMIGYYDSEPGHGYSAITSQSDIPMDKNYSVPDGGETILTFFFYPQKVIPSTQVHIKYVLHDYQTGSIIGETLDRDYVGNVAQPDKTYTPGSTYTRMGKDIDTILHKNIPGDYQLLGAYGSVDFRYAIPNGVTLTQDSYGGYGEYCYVNKTVDPYDPNIIDVYANLNGAHPMTQKIVTVDVNMEKPNDGLDEGASLEKLIKDKALTVTSQTGTDIQMGNGTVDIKLTGITAPATYKSDEISKMWTIKTVDLSTDELSQNGMIDYKIDRTISPYDGMKFTNQFINPYNSKNYAIANRDSSIPGAILSQQIDTDSPSVMYTYYIKFKGSSVPKFFFSTDGGGTLTVENQNETNNPNDDKVSNSTTTEKTVLLSLYDKDIFTESEIAPNKFKGIKAWGGGLAAQTEDTATLDTSGVGWQNVYLIWARDTSVLDKYNGAHIKAIFKDGPTKPVDPPSTGGSGTIKFDPNSCTWTNKGKTAEGTGVYPVRAYYEGDNPVHGIGVATIHHHEEQSNPPDADGNATAPTIIDYTYQENVDVTFQLQSITVSGDASAFISGASGNVNITKEGKALKLHGEGAWADGVAAQPTVGANESVVNIQLPDKPAAPVGDSGEYNIDWTRPDIQIDPPNSLWVNHPTPYPVNVSVIENLSGFDSNSTVTVTDSSHYNRNASDNLTPGGMNYNKVINLYDGIYTITASTGDVATNTNTVVSRTYYVDQTQADATFSVLNSIFSEDNGAIKEENGGIPTLYGVLTLSDNLSGVYKAQYSWTFSNLDYGDYTDLTAAGGDHYSCLGGAENMYKYTYFDRYLERPKFKIEKPVGDNLYLHVKIWDTAGNYTYKVFGPYEDPIMLKDFKITDVRDPEWDSVFWKDSNFTMPTGVTFPVSKLPIDNTSNPVYKNATVKTGYFFYFDLTSEFLYRNYDNIVITPTFYSIINNQLVPLDVYYLNADNPFCKVGSDQDNFALHLNTKLGNVLLGGYSKLTLTQGVRVFDGKPYYNPGGWVGQIQYNDGKIQWWYSRYTLPATSIFVKQGDTPRPENLVKSDVIVNFQIVANKNGAETLGSNQTFTYVPNQWLAEGGPKTTGTYKYKPGDVIVYDNRFTGQGSNADFRSYITQ